MSEERERPAGTAGTMGADGEEAPEGGARFQRLRTWGLALAGIVISSLVAALVTNYFDTWTSAGDIPGGRGLHAESQVWWDKTRDVRTVAMPHSVDLDDLGLAAGDADGQFDALVKDGGSYAGMMRIRLTLMNFAKSPVVITGVRAVPTAEKPVPSGPSFSCGGAQGSTGVTRVRLDLGSADKEAEEYDGDELVGRYPAEQIQLAKQDEPAIFDVRVKAGPTFYTYVIEIHYTQGTTKGTLRVDDGGKPFALGPVNKRATHYRCDENTNTWVRS
ncbi:hypothetical protein [Streptomyces ochraceiscleroticus]|uniref:Uncharacterized protein n=1 Tax=Streptomyces ochraceiscleroticus TaxID=47761 RepID=A0ABW1MG32_9ACTN|nr:hypothetical protein [Streptomyces ochraceiscleroticus]